MAKKVKLSPKEHQRCLKCVWCDKQVLPLIKCSRVKCVYEVKANDN